jgi:hypothetical protein
MNEQQPSVSANSAGKNASIVGGAVATVVALVLLAAGGALLWVDAAKTDKAGYYSTGTHRFQATTRALASESMNVGSDVPSWLVGNVRVRATSDGAKPVFVGVARTSDVDAYLAGVAHTNIHDLDFGPFRVGYSDRQGARRPAAAAAQTFWAASATGQGTQSITWKLRSGHWSVVVMNADGSPGIAADVAVGAKTPIVVPAALGFVGGGALLVLVATALLYVGTRGPRTSRVASPELV